MIFWQNRINKNQIVRGDKEMAVKTEGKVLSIKWLSMVNLLRKKIK